MDKDKKKQKKVDKKEERDLTREEFYRVLRSTSVAVREKREDQPDKEKSET